MTSMNRHRFFFVPTREDLPIAEAIDHWETHHGAVFAATPDLGGYVQHQPTRADQERLGGRVCAEAWFADRDAEQRAWASDHYVGPVTEDELRFVDRAKAWAPPVRSQETVGPAEVAGAGGVGHEVVGVGCDPASLPDGVSARVLNFDKPGPAGGPPHVVIATVADEPTAQSVAAQLQADVVFVARLNPVKPPPA